MGREDFRSSLHGLSGTHGYIHELNLSCADTFIPSHLVLI